MVRNLLIALVVLAARTASAGVCLGPEEADADMKLIEAFAKDAAKKAPVDEAYAFLCVELDAKRLRARVEKACTKILDRDGDGSECTLVMANAGFAKVGKHDLFAWIAKHVEEDPIDSPGGVGPTKVMLLAATGDARALPWIVDLWKASIPRAEAREKKHREMMSWSGWRQRAAVAIGELGGKDEIAFLDEQAKATKDKHVAEECRNAIAAIEKRLAAKP